MFKRKKQYDLITSIVFGLFLTLVIILVYPHNVSANTYDSEVNRTAHIQTGDDNAVWDVPYGTEGASWISSGSKYNGNLAQIIREAHIDDRVYYQFKVDDVLVGWMDKRAFQDFGDGFDYDKSVYKTGYVQSGDENSVWSEPYEVSRTRWLASGAQYNWSYVEIVREAKVEGRIYYQFKVNGKLIGWMDQQAFWVFNDTPHYDKEVKMTAQITDGDQNGIWTKPFAEDGTQFLGYGGQYNGKRAEIVRETETNHERYYQFKIDGKLIGWMNTKAFSKFGDIIDYEKDIYKTAYVQTGNENSVWSDPYAVSGTQWLASGGQYNWSYAEIVKEAKVEGRIYYQFKVNGQLIGWMDQHAFWVFNDTPHYDKEVKMTAQITGGDQNGIWTKPFAEDGTQFLGYGGQYDRKRAELVREIETDHEKYYQFKVDGRLIGWMNTKAFSSFGDAIDYNKSVYKTGYVQTGDENAVWSEPYNISGAQWLASGGQYNWSYAEIVREAKVEGRIYYQFKVNGQLIGWMDQHAFWVYNDTPHYDREVKMTAQITAGDQNGIWTKPFAEDGTQFLGYRGQYNGKRAEIIREVETNHETYYQFKVNGNLIGWMNTKAFSNYGDGIDYDRSVYKTGYVQTGDDNSVWSDPYAVSGVRWIASGPQFNNRHVEIVREAKVEGRIYYQFKVNGRIIGWMDENAFTFFQSRKQKFIGYQGTVFLATDAALNVRKGPSTKYSVIKTLHSNDVVTVIGEAVVKVNGENQYWLQIKTGSETGYVSATYLQKGNSPVNGGNSSNPSIPPSNQNTKKGIDVSHYQGVDAQGNTTIDYTAVKNQGYQFVIAKATQGQDYVDSSFASNIQRANEAGLSTNAYHFFEANSVNDAIAEADHFIEFIKKSPVNGYIFLDVEDPPSPQPTLEKDPNKLTTYVNAFFNRLYDSGYRKFGLYTNRSFYYNRLIISNLPNNAVTWISRYRYNRAEGWDSTYKGAEVPSDIWQYQSDGSVIGIHGNVDINISYSDIF
ncbi:GW domain-containing glycosaminoglycan-binding protein [Sporolactobacillus terrae]|uniref:Lysozyme n=1 Tax=Sporolactobacillus terrae TaxID=269673 RepID=A0ABX5Q4J4_9BACL|nr:GW domain-containing glycosaminoglycan-binding protein [Sporolactobacillus terrae]QAA21563.1 hypothetical protein C0674_02380 [Sporolactobacillus terrae]QAA24535.1 hypothetical protein C0679_02360 [Sporolactobacillus terrae]